MGRFIPACAGNSWDQPSKTQEFPVHPRVCGEQHRKNQKRRFLAGSSPRVRGTGCAGCWRHLSLRFIPACAGNRLRQKVSRWRPAVHPRVCGEQKIISVPRPDLVGSSPRVRGTEPCEPCAVRQFRFIPACAGNSSSRAVGDISTPVHPRVCGEQPR